jgi:Glycosyl hydrolase family 76
MLGVTVPAASASTVPPSPPTPAQAASTAASRLLADYNASGTSDGLFTTTGDPSVSTCKSTYHGGQCWWWAANTFMALITYAEDNPHSAATPKIENDVAHTYSVMCGQGSCPTGAYETGQDSFQNTYYDDTGWWEQAWINAYKLTHLTDYLYLAEELWSYITTHGWNGDCDGGVNQHNGTGNFEDSYANALYLRNSAWLYSITGNAQYMTGLKVGKSKKGGALTDATFIVNHLIDGPYNKITPGTEGSEFMIADHPTDGCKSVGGTQMWLGAEGEMVNAFSDMYAADKSYGAKDPGYYNNLADELARTVIGNKAGTHGSIIGTVDSNGVLSEPCQSASWPAGCTLVKKKGAEAPFRSLKGSSSVASTAPTTTSMTPPSRASSRRTPPGSRA